MFGGVGDLKQPMLTLVECGCDLVARPIIKSLRDLPIATKDDEVHYYYEMRKSSHAGGLPPECLDMEGTAAGAQPFFHYLSLYHAIH